MKFKKLVKGAISKQLLKGVAAKGSLDDIVYGEYYRVLNLKNPIVTCLVRFPAGCCKKFKKIIRI